MDEFYTAAAQGGQKAAQSGGAASAGGGPNQAPERNAHQAGAENKGPQDTGNKPPQNTGDTATQDASPNTPPDTSAHGTGGGNNPNSEQNSGGGTRMDMGKFAKSLGKAAVMASPAGNLVKAFGKGSELASQFDKDLLHHVIDDYQRRQPQNPDDDNEY